MTLTFDNRQLAFLCAAAHYWQRTEHYATSQDLERATDCGRFPVLSAVEILKLANQLAMARSVGDEPSSETHSLQISDANDDIAEPHAQATSHQSTSRRKPITINLSEVDWEDRSPMGAKPRSRLITVLRFNRVCHHLDAIEVRLGRGYRDQVAVDESCQAQLERYQRSDIDLAPFHTVILDGRRYVLFATPFSY
jgi:hypothetical protein